MVLEGHGAEGANLEQKVHFSTPRVTSGPRGHFCAQGDILGKKYTFTLKIIFLRPGASRTIQKPCARATFSPGVAEVHFFDDLGHF